MCKNTHIKFFGTKLPIKFQNWGKIPINFFFYFFTHHPLLRHHHIRADKYISFLHVLVRDDESIEDDAPKNQKINCDGQFCPSFEI